MAAASPGGPEKPFDAYGITLLAQALPKWILSVLRVQFVIPDTACQIPLTRRGPSSVH